MHCKYWNTQGKVAHFSIVVNEINHFHTFIQSEYTFGCITRTAFPEITIKLHHKEKYKWRFYRLKRPHGIITRKAGEDSQTNQTASATNSCYDIRTSWQNLFCLQLHADDAYVARYSHWPRCVKTAVNINDSYSCTIFARRGNSWFSLMWWDGHVGVQTNGKMSLKFCRITE